MIVENCGMLGLPVKDGAGNIIGKVTRHDYGEDGTYTTQIQFEQKITAEIIKNKEIIK